MNDTLDDAQADAVAFELLLRVQPLEDPEQLRRSSDPHDRPGGGAAEFHSVRQEVDPDLPEQVLVALRVRQLTPLIPEFAPGHRLRSSMLRAPVASYREVCG